MTEVATKPSGAENVRWDLSDLYPGLDAAEIATDIAAIEDRINSFDATYRGNVANLSADELRVALQAYETIREMMARLGNFANLNWVTDTANEIARQFLTRIQHQNVAFGQRLIFFQLEWMEVSEDIAALADAPELAHYQHYLKQSRLYAPHILTESEEKIVSELSLSGMTAWSRYFGEVMSASRFELDGERLGQEQILAKVQSPDRDLRQRAADGFTDGLHKLSHTTTYVFNMMLTHKRSMNKLRDYPNWISSRNMANELDDADVEALIDAVTGRYDIVRRYYQLTGRILGYETLYDYDRYAPMLPDDSHTHWDDAKALILESLAVFHPQAADVAQRFFDDHWIDAALGPNKRSGAFSSSTIPSAHPYIMMNYQGTVRNVSTLAHELGHGIHQYLSREQGYLQCDTPLTTAEMASTFCEMLVFDALMGNTDDLQVRLANRIEKIGDTFATVFRQISMNRFEDASHNAARQQGQLSTDHISELWMETQEAMFGESVVLRDQYQLWWSYIPHFISVPGYVYAYSFGELLVWALYARYQDERGDFADRYLQALAKGGSDWPHKILAPLGVDLKDPEFWHEGLNLIDNMVAEAEQEADALAL